MAPTCVLAKPNSTILESNSRSSEQHSFDSSKTSQQGVPTNRTLLVQHSFDSQPNDSPTNYPRNHDIGGIMRFHVCVDIWKDLQRERERE
jgi:hypothetical protein